MRAGIPQARGVLILNVATRLPWGNMRLMSETNARLRRPVLDEHIVAKDPLPGFFRHLPTLPFNVHTLLTRANRVQGNYDSFFPEQEVGCARHSLPNLIDLMSSTRDPERHA